MRYMLILALLLLAFGCISLSERSAAENVTGPEPAVNGTPQPAQSSGIRYQAKGFSFIYPSGMETEESKGSWSGIFSGTTELVGGQTGEIIIVTYIDTKSVYGLNQDKIFKDDPTTAVSDFVEDDIEYDPAGGLLSSAYEVGEQSTFAIARDGVVAEVPFSIRFSDSTKSYSGYAMDMYIPERSMHIKMRVVALDPAKAESIRDEFLLSFRLE